MTLSPLFTLCVPWLPWSLQVTSHVLLLALMISSWAGAVKGTGLDPYSVARAGLHLKGWRGPCMLSRSPPPEQGVEARSGQNLGYSCPCDRPTPLTALPASGLAPMCSFLPAVQKKRVLPGPQLSSPLTRKLHGAITMGTSLGTLMVKGDLKKLSGTPAHRVLESTPWKGQERREGKAGGRPGAGRVVPGARPRAPLVPGPA